MNFTSILSLVLPKVVERKFTVLVPIYDEVKALSFAKFYYDALGISPLWVLDSKMLSRRDQIENFLGQEVKIYENDRPFAEANYERLIQLSPSDWVLRIDCDEVPTRAILDFCRHSVISRKAIVGFDRKELVWRNSSILHLTLPRHMHRQWRFFDRSYVKYDTKVHTSGIILPWRRLVKAPEPSNLFHFDRIFSSPEMRSAKSIRYTSYGQTSINAEWYLPTSGLGPATEIADEFLSQNFKEWNKFSDNHSDF